MKLNVTKACRHIVNQPLVGEQLGKGSGPQDCIDDPENEVVSVARQIIRIIW